MEKGWDDFRGGVPFSKSMPKAWQRGWLDSEQDALERWWRECELERLMRSYDEP